MCDIFPDVSSCCFCISLRVGMLLISVLAIMTGVISLGVVAQKTDLHYHDIYNIKNINRTPLGLQAGAQQLLGLLERRTPLLFFQEVIYVIIASISETLMGCSHAHTRIPSNILSEKIHSVLPVAIDTGSAADKSSTLVSTGIAAFSCAFMFTGLMLLFGTLFDSEGLVQVFVWITFLNVITGLNMVIAISVECLLKTSCILSDLDWLSASIVLVLTVAYMFLWIYFISVSNSYVVTVQ